MLPREGVYLRSACERSEKERGERHCSAVGRYLKAKEAFDKDTCSALIAKIYHDKPHRSLSLHSTPHPRIDTSVRERYAISQTPSREEVSSFQIEAAHLEAAAYDGVELPMGTRRREGANPLVPASNCIEVVETPKLESPHEDDQMMLEAVGTG